MRVTPRTTTAAAAAWLIDAPWPTQRSTTTPLGYVTMAQPALTLLLSLLSFGAHAQTIAVNNKTLTSRACFAKPDFPFCNTSLSIDARVANLISLLEDVDIVPQLQARHGGGGSPGAPSNVSRIGLPGV